MHTQLFSLGMACIMRNAMYTIMDISLVNCHCSNHWRAVLKMIEGLDSELPYDEAGNDFRGRLRNLVQLPGWFYWRKAVVSLILPPPATPPLYCLATPPLDVAQPLLHPPPLLGVTQAIGITSLSPNATTASAVRTGSTIPPPPPTPPPYYSAAPLLDVPLLVSPTASRKPRRPLARHLDHCHPDYDGISGGIQAVSVLASSVPLKSCEQKLPRAMTGCERGVGSEYNAEEI